jgi:hypothetical protein
VDAPIRRFLAATEPFGARPDPEQLAAEVRELVLDEDYWRFQIARADGGNLAVHRAEQGIQVALARRTAGTMSYVHSHQVWVALSAVAGVETHRRYDVRPLDEDHAHVVLADERLLRGGSGEVVTMLPPHDVHSHGHVEGSGEWPWTVIVLGDDQLRYEREEYDLATGRRHTLLPGDRGITNLPSP